MVLFPCQNATTGKTIIGRKEMDGWIKGVCGKPAVLPLLPELGIPGLQITHGFIWFHRGLLSAAIPSLNQESDFELIGEKIKHLTPVLPRLAGWGSQAQNTSPPGKI